MRNTNLVCVYGNPKSGTSIIAAILVAHGIYAEPGEPNGHGYITHEWQEMKNIITPPGKGWTLSGEPWSPPPGVFGEVRRLLAERPKPCLFKGSPEYDVAFFGIPRTIIKVDRSPEFIAKSQAAPERVAVIHRRHELMYTMPGLWVVPDEIVNGDYSGLASVMKKLLRIKLDPEKVRAVVKPEMWSGDNAY